MPKREWIIGTCLAAAAFLAPLQQSAWAEKTDDAMIPPDVTYSTASPGVVPGVAVPGQAAPAGGVPGLPAPGSGPWRAGAGLGTAPPGGGISPGNGFGVPNSGRVTATISKPPGTPFSTDANAPPANEQQSNGLYQGSGVPVDENAPDPVAVITTVKGTITIRLFRKYAPKTVDSFMDLVGRGFYNGLIFHRVEPGFCIQGGDPNGNGTGIFIDPQSHMPRLLGLETSPYLKHNVAGVVAMAHSQSLDSGSCQFYITLSSQPSLDGKYTVFGGVTSGMDVVQKIQLGDKILSITMQPAQ